MDTRMFSLCGSWLLFQLSSLWQCSRRVVCLKNAAVKRIRKAVAFAPFLSMKKAGAIINSGYQFICLYYIRIEIRKSQPKFLTPTDSVCYILYNNNTITFSRLFKKKRYIPLTLYIILKFQNNAIHFLIIKKIGTVFPFRYFYAIFIISFIDTLSSTLSPSKFSTLGSVAPLCHL